MDEQRDTDGAAGSGPAEVGMGPEPRGPAFAPGTTPAFPRPAQSATIASPAPVGPPPGRRPALITALVVGVVAVVVTAATLIAWHADTHIPAPPPIPPASASPTPDGTGRLIMVTRSWVRSGEPQPINGTYLRVEIELICESGQVDYDPYNFQAFDSSGRLFEFAEEGAGGGVLDVGTLRPGQSVSGRLAFDIPRGEVTLLMSDETEQAVTALRVPD